MNNEHKPVSQEKAELKVEKKSSKKLKVEPFLLGTFPASDPPSHWASGSQPKKDEGESEGESS